MEDPPSRITFHRWGETVLIEKPYSDITIEEFHDMCMDLAIAAGFSDEDIGEWFD